MKKSKLYMGLALLAMAPSAQAIVYSEWDHLLFEPIDEIVVTAPRITEEGGLWQYNMLMQMMRWADGELALAGISGEFSLDAMRHYERSCAAAVAEWRDTCELAVAGTEMGCAGGAILLGGRILGAVGYLTCAGLSAAAAQQCETIENPVEGCD